MLEAQFRELVDELEVSAQHSEGGYRLRVALLAALGYVYVILVVALTHQRSGRAGGHRYVVAGDVVEHANRVLGRPLQRVVAEDGGHAQQLDLGAREREHQGDSVVVSRIAVEDDPGHGASIASTSSAVGSEDWAPSREVASAPAAQARRRASA